MYLKETDRLYALSQFIIMITMIIINFSQKNIQYHRNNKLLIASPQAILLIKLLVLGNL